MDIKFFPLDKNYILKEAQETTKEQLLSDLVEKVRYTYLSLHNPLGLEDDPILKIKKYQLHNTEQLENFYQALAGIYRFKFGNNQLELLFDGRSHYEKYQDEWREMFGLWTKSFCLHENFLKAVLEATVFLEDSNNVLIENRMKTFITRYFELKISKQRGLPAFRIA